MHLGSCSQDLASPRSPVNRARVAPSAGSQGLPPLGTWGRAKRALRSSFGRSGTSGAFPASSSSSSFPSRAHAFDPSDHPKAKPSNLPDIRSLAVPSFPARPVTQGCSVQSSPGRTPYAATFMCNDVIIGRHAPRAESQGSEPISKVSVTYHLTRHVPSCTSERSCLAVGRVERSSDGPVDESGRTVERSHRSKASTRRDRSKGVFTTPSVSHVAASGQKHPPATTSPGDAVIESRALRVRGSVRRFPYNMARVVTVTGAAAYSGVDGPGSFPAFPSVGPGVRSRKESPTCAMS